ncbi:Pex19 protein family-domain-containing protein [Halteromyces radiatus]|uniref:Pex19 protein family-domain-containing protein n=1 Tax=Halteromyces radiatus TaxID=101107 RepID=UPI00221F0F5F|nr:Pex19 protein family-domain-containing protein [Halteromyces radiatus]KAI8096509.1 Pex19 protein family-domain-containing protein [Halteromyces radiatus]
MSKQQEPTKTIPSQNDDSDLDDLLDDVLDDFNGLSTKETTKETNKETNKDTTNDNKTSDKTEESLDDMLDNEAFAKQLQAGMEELMGNMEQDPEMKAAFEKVWGSFDPTTLANQDKSETAKPSTTDRAVPGASFQDTIAQTMNKLKDSSKQVDSSISEENDDAFMAELMKQMEGLTEGGDLENVLEGMMSQLMSKEMLYEPMKDMVSKYPPWLEENKDKTEKTQFEKYQQQYEMCQKIVAEYEAPGFDENNEQQAKKIMDLMTAMQDLGQPPASLLEDMAPGMNFGNPEGMPDMKDLENCTIM